MLEYTELRGFGGHRAAAAMGLKGVTLGRDLSVSMWYVGAADLALSVGCLTLRKSC